MKEYNVEYFSAGNWKLYEEINHGRQKASYSTRETAERRIAGLRSVWWGGSTEFRITEIPLGESEAERAERNALWAEAWNSL